MFSRRRRVFNYRATLHQIKNKYQKIDSRNRPRPDSIFVKYLRQSVEDKFYDYDRIHQTRHPKNVERLEMCMERFWWSVAVDLWERLFFERCPFIHLQPLRDSSNPYIDQVREDPDLTGLRQSLIMAQYRYDLDTAVDEIDNILSVRTLYAAAQGTTDLCRPPQPYKSKIREALMGTIGVPAPDGVTERAHELWYWVDDFGGPAPTYTGCGPWEIPLPAGFNAKVYFENRASALCSRLGVKVTPISSKKPHRMQIDPIPDAHRRLDDILFYQWRAFRILQDWVDDFNGKGYCVDVVEFCDAQFRNATIGHRRRSLQKVLAETSRDENSPYQFVGEASQSVHEFKIRGLAEFKIRGLAEHVKEGSSLHDSHTRSGRKHRLPDYDGDIETTDAYGGSHWKRLRYS